MEDKRPIDVRIIVEGASDVETISKALQMISLGSEYHVTISSIIPTTSVEIAQRAVEGADIVLIATDVDPTGRELAKKFEKSLKDHVGHVERIKLPYGHDVEYIDSDLLKKEIKNAIVRSGLSSLPNIRHCNQLEEKIDELENQIKSISEENKKLKKSKDELESELENFEKKYKELKDKYNELKERYKNIEEKYKSVKSNYEEMKKRGLLEAFSLKELWAELFGEEVDEDKIVKITNNVKPKDIIVGQGLICAPSKKRAIEWLNIIKTALTIVE